MSGWTNDELNKIGIEDELWIAAERIDGTLRKLTIIWMVRVGDDIYVRSAHETNAAWYRGTQVRHEGRIWAGGVEKDVTFVDIPAAEDSIHSQIDAEYRKKYRRYPSEYVRPVVSVESRSVTLKLIPRSTNA